MADEERPAALPGDLEVGSAEPHGAPPDDDAAIEQDVDQLLQSPDEKEKGKIRAALIATKKTLRETSRRVKELEPIASRVAETDARVDKVMPIVNAILADPRLKAEALRKAGFAPEPGTEQEPEPNGPELDAFAEEYGRYLTDGVTPDRGWAAKAMARQQERFDRQIRQAIQPLAAMTLEEKAQANILAAMNAKDGDGTPLATAESIQEAVSMMGMDRRLLANPQVADVVTLVAVGIDRKKGRTPQAASEPLRLESAGGRGPRRPAYSQDDRRVMEKLGLTEKDLDETDRRIARSTKLGRQLE